LNIKGGTKGGLRILDISVKFRRIKIRKPEKEIKKYSKPKLKVISQSP
jgi:hypothetical protein